MIDWRTLELAYVLEGIRAAMVYLLARDLGASKRAARWICWGTVLVWTLVR